MTLRVQTTCALAAMMLLCVGARQAAADPAPHAAYTFSCAVNGDITPMFTVDATGYSLQLPPPNIGSSGSGAGAGKVTYSTLSVQMPASQFTAEILSTLAAGTHTCMLTPVDKTSPAYRFSLVSLTGITYGQTSGEDDNSRRNWDPANTEVDLSLSYARVAIRGV